MKKRWCCQVVDMNLYREKDGGGTKLCIWIIRDILGERLKKRWGCLNCGFEISKKWKGKQEKKKMGVAELCIWNVRDLLRRREIKKMGLAKLWIWN